MNKYEKDDISGIPSEYRPIGAWAYFGYTVLFCIPVLGFLCVIIMSFVRGNVNRRSFARFYLLLFTVLLVILGIAVGVLFATGAIYPLIDIIKAYLVQLGIKF